MQKLLSICVFATVLWSTMTSLGSTLNISAYVTTSFGGEVDTTQSINPATGRNQLVSANSLPYIFGTGGYYVRAKFGNLGLSFNGSEDCTDPAACFQIGTGGTVSASSTDAIFVTGASTSDFLAFHIIVDGSVNEAANAQAGSGDSASAYYLLQALGVTAYTAGASCTNQFPSCASGTSANATVLLPLSYYNSTTLDTVLVQRLFAQFGCTAAPGYPCSVSGDFVHTAEISDAKVVDANGLPVSGATITSGSGYDYTQSLNTSSVPEISSIGFVLTGLSTLSFEVMRRLKRADKPMS